MKSTYDSKKYNMKKLLYLLLITTACGTLSITEAQVGKKKE